MGSLLSSCTLSVVIIPLSLTVRLQFAMQILTCVPTPNLLFPWGTWGPCLMQCYFRITRVSLQNSISFHPSALAGYTSVIDGQTDIQSYGSRDKICCSRWNRQTLSARPPTLPYRSYRTLPYLRGGCQGTPVLRPHQFGPNAQPRQISWSKKSIRGFCKPQESCAVDTVKSVQ